MTESTGTATIELPPVQNLDVPAAWAPAKERDLIKEILQDMLANGWSRPMISAITQFSDSQVYRAKEGAAHTVEVERWNAFLQGVNDGTFKPVEKARKGGVKQAVERARQAAALLAKANDLRTAKEVKELVVQALALLPTPIVEATDTEATEAEVPEPAPAQD